MAILIIFFVISIAFSFLCSILEAVILSITPAFIRKQQTANPQLYESLIAFKDDIDRPLSAILTLNTIAHTVGAIGVGAQAANVFGSTNIEIFTIQIAAESIVATVMTLAILILSEIIPKTIGANNWKNLTPFTVKTLQILITLLMPLVWLSQRITKKLKSDKNKSVLGRADLMALTIATSEEGKLSEPETNVIKNVLNLPNKTIHEVMTPRTVLFSISIEDTIQSVMSEKRFKEFSRVPVFAKNNEEVLGIVLKSDILWRAAHDQHDVALEELIRPVGQVKEDTLIADFFKNNYKKKAHVFIVVDTYGSVTGIVTMEDILETILGYEIVDETDAVADLQSLVKNDHSGQNSSGSEDQT